MASFRITRHAEMRMQQRGRRPAEIEFVLQHGTEAPKGIMLTRKDVAAIEQEAKRQIALAVYALRSRDAAPDDAEWDACNAMVEAFVQAHPDDPEGLVFRGEIERSRGRHADAVEQHERALSINPADVRAC